MLDNLAQRCAESRLHRMLLFAAATLLSVMVLGYYFGTFDQAIHIPFLKKYADPSLYPNDPFFDLRLRHYSFFWFPFVWLYQLGILEVSMFIVHLLVTFLTFWALWQLSETLFGNPLAALLTVVGLALPHAGFAGFTMIEWSLLNRTFVLPFLFIAITIYLRGRTVLAFGMLGVLYNLHVVSVNFVLAMFMLDCLLQIRSVGWRSLLAGIGVFLVAASPVLIWRLMSGQSPGGADWEWFSLLSRSYFYHLFHLLGPYPQVLAVTFGGISTAVIFFLAQRTAPAPNRNRSMVHFVIAALLIIVVQLVATHVYPATLLIQAQIMRAGVFVMIFAYIYFAHYLATRHQNGELVGLDFGILVSAMILSLTPLILLATWGLMHWLRPARLRRIVGVIAVPVAFLATATMLYQSDLWRPGIAIFPRETPWTDAQRWARENTPRDAVFITPPERWWLFDEEWRVLSERSTVTTLSELLEIAFEPGYLPRWQERFAALAPGAEQQLAGDVLANNLLTADAFYGLSSEELQRIGQRYGATYLVVQRSHQHNFPIAYQNAEFTIYRLDSPGAAQGANP